MNRVADNSSSSQAPLAIATGLAGVFFGVIVGYIMGAQQLQPGVASAAAAPPAASNGAPATPIVNEGELQAYRNILASDPKNARAAIELGNRLYDAGRFAEAIPYYQQAITVDPKNVSVSTDLGTALWSVGRADDALAQFAASLAIDPKHPQTLFNRGIVRMEGKQDAAGAITSWEELLRISPSYPEADRVRRLIEDAKKKTG